MKFFRDAYLSINETSEVPAKEQFIEIFDRINMDESEFTKDRFIPGTKWQSDLYKELLEKSGILMRE